MTKTYICPHVSCPLYENWVKQTGDDRLDIVFSVSLDKKNYFGCKALEIGQDISPGELEGRLPLEILDPNLECLHITQLNLMENILEAVDL